MTDPVPAREQQGYWCGHEAHVPGDCPWTTVEQQGDTQRIEFEGGVYLIREACDHGTWAFLFVHPCDDDPELSATPGICVGTVPTCAQHGARSVWTIEIDEPLTLSPSILCTQHGTHGFVRGGKWVSA